MSPNLKYYYRVFSPEFIKSHGFLNMRTVSSLTANQNILSSYQSIIMKYFFKYNYPVLSVGFIQLSHFATKKTTPPLPTNQNILSFYHPIILSL